MDTAQPPSNSAVPSAEPQRPGPVSLGQALVYWLKLGFVSFGGPAGQIAIMHTDLVEKKRWISEQRFLHALNYCMVLPGPEAQQLATYIGWLMHRTWGGIIAGGLFVLPSLFFLAGLSYIYLAFGNVPVVAGILYGIKPAVTAIVLHAAWRIGSRALKNAWLWAITAAAFIAIFAFAVPFPAIVLGAGLIGWVGGKYAPKVFSGGGHGAAKTSFGPALIDDDTPAPLHAKFSRTRLITIAVVFLALWGVTLAALSGTLADMGWFFTKAALLTFGGAYAVLPYVTDAAVNQYQWATAAQMIDGLALGETTPGPLIMIVAFVGFVGAWTKQLFGGDLVLAGMAGACVATWFTFLPSFLFILAGGPLVESTHGNLKFTAPLTAISAAVVGVILNLAMFFAWHVFFPASIWSQPDWLAILIGADAMAALFRYQTEMISLIGACALIGLLRTVVV